MEQITMRVKDLATPVRSAGLYEKIVLHVIRSLRRGSLTVTMPDRQVLQAGQDGSLPRASLKINSPDFFRRSVLFGDLGFAESYIDGDWETDNLTALLKIFLLNIEEVGVLSGSQKTFLPLNMLKVANRAGYLLRKNTRSGSKRNIADHYDLGNEFFSLFLDPGLTYSSAVFTRDGESLEEAQREKYDRLCRKLKLKATDHVLEIGTGWGGFALHAAKNYGCRVVTATISRKQFDFAAALFRREGVDDRTEVRLQDYRDIAGQFDKIVSIEMLEAVGDNYLPTYFRKCHELLKKDGILGLQVITSPDSRYAEFKKGIDFIQKHIFPGSLLPSIGVMNRAVNATGTMQLHHLEEFGLSYAKTLAVWKQAFNQKLEQMRLLGFDDYFIRKWNYYFSYCEAGFATRNINVVQMIYARPNNPYV